MRYGLAALTRAICLQYRALFDRDPAAVLALVLVALTAIVLLLEARTRRGAGFRASPEPPDRRRGSRSDAALAALGGSAGSSSDSSSSSRWRCSSTGRSRAVATSSCRGRRRCVRSGPPGYSGRSGRDRRAPGRVPRRPLATTVDGRAGRAAYASNALPGIVIALSLVFFAARYAGRCTRRSRCSSSRTSCASSRRRSPTPRRRSRR